MAFVFCDAFILFIVFWLSRRDCLRWLNNIRAVRLCNKNNQLNYVQNQRLAKTCQKIVERVV